MEHTENSNVEFSVIIASYQSSFKNILLSIDSVLQQNFKSVEIVICDDASCNNFFTEIEAYFKERNFEKYQLIAQKENQGTVKNFISALEKANGKYIKSLGAGDMLYDSNSIKIMHDFLTEKECPFAFGLCQKFNWKDGAINKGSVLKAPAKLGLYYHTDLVSKWLQKMNIAACGEVIYGISMFGRRDGFLYYISQLKDISRLTEDIFQLLVYLDGGQFVYLNEKIAWYEYGTGTSFNIKTARVVNKDVERVFSYAWSRKSKLTKAKWMLDVHQNYYGLVFLLNRILFRINNFIEKRSVHNAGN